MSLSGSLLDFNFTDILQLVKMQRKTGCLALRSRETTAAFWFEDGDLIFAHDDAHPMTSVVGRRLGADGLVGEAAWRRAVEEQRRSARPLADLLVGVDPEPLAPLATEYLRESVFAVFRWIEGDYTFDTEIPSPPEAGAIPVPPIDTGDLLMEAAQRSEAWSVVDGEIPSWRLIFAATGGAMPAPDPGDGYGPVEAHVLGLLDGRRDVQEVVGWSRYGALETCQGLAFLKVAGRIVAVGERAPRPGAQGASRKRKAAQRKRIQGLPVWRVAWRTGVVAIGCTALVAGVGWKGYQAYTQGGLEALSPLARSTANYREHQVRQALEVYHLVHGAYPDHLDLLLDTGLLSGPAVTTGMRYVPTGDGFTLHLG
jgi:hypothetical protein